MAKWCFQFPKNILEFFKNLREIAGFQDRNNSPQLEDFAHIFRRKTRAELLRISAAVMGIEFCYAAETAFTSPAILKIGVRHSYMSLIWCLSPLIGFFLTPILGSLSDKCNSKLGKRRPFILGLSVGIIMGLLFVPNGKAIGIGIGDSYSSQTLNPEVTQVNVTSAIAPNTSGPSEGPLPNDTSNAHPWGILFTILGTVLLDFDADACQSPSRAYLLDITVSEDHVKGLSAFTIMAGLGGSLGYAMGAINWDLTGLGKKLGGQERTVFTIILFIFVICVMVTIFSFREIPLEFLEKVNKQNTAHLHNSEKSAEKKAHKLPARTGHYKKLLEEEIDEDEMKSSNNQSTCHSQMHDKTAIYHSKNYGSVHEDDGNASALTIKGGNFGNFEETSFTSSQYNNGNDVYQSRESHKNKQILASDSTMDQTILSDPKDLGVIEEPQVDLKHYLYSIVHLPKSLRLLCLTNLFSWMSLVAYSLYFTDFVGEAVFNGDPQAQDGSLQKVHYEEGVRFGCWGMALYSLACSIYSLTIDKLIQTFGARPIYIGGHLVYSFGMLMLALSRHRVAVILLSCTAGIMYATLFTMPYLLVAHYHTHNMFGDIKGEASSGQIRGLGTDIAVVSSMVFLAQFTLSLCMGPLVNLIGSTVAIVFTASFLSFCGALCATQVMYFNL